MMDDVSLIFPKNVKDKKEFYLYHFFFLHTCMFISQVHNYFEFYRIFYNYFYF